MRISNKNFIIIVFILAVINGIVWGMPFDRPLGSDAITFDETALTILKKGVFNNEEIMQNAADRIFYPMFLAGTYSIFGRNPTLVRFIQIFIFAGLVVLVYKLCQLVFDERLARLSAIITAFCYSISSFTGSLYREVIFATLIFLLIYFLYLAQLKNRNIWFIAAGATLGISVLTNAIIQFFVVFIVINFLIINRKKIKEVIPKLILLVFVFVLVLSPWAVSNYLNFGRRPVPFGSKQGLVLYMRIEKMNAIKGKYIQHFIANTTGDFVAQKLFPDYNRAEARLGWENREKWQEMIDEGDSGGKIDDELTQQSVKEFVKHPLLSLQMASLDFLKFNTPMVPNVRMQHMFAEPGSHPELSDAEKIAIILFIRFIYLIFAVIIVYAIVKNIKRWAKISWIVLIIIYFNLIFSSIHAIARYSVPVYPFYIILLAIGLLCFYDKIFLRKTVKIC